MCILISPLPCATHATIRYLEIVSELLLTVRQMENTLHKRKVTARRGSRAGGGDQGPSDKDKIMMQVRD